MDAEGSATTEHTGGVTVADELITITNAIKAKVKEAGTNKLNSMQLALSLGITDFQCRQLMEKHPELMAEYAKGETEIALKQLDTLKRIADNDEHPQQSTNARYLYELYTNRHQNNNITINMSRPKDDNQKFLEIIDAETIERIKND